jgi:hypothetical protein
MKDTRMTGLPKNGKGFTEYKGNIVSRGASLPKPHSGTRASGGKVTNNLNKTAVRKSTFKA